MLSTSVCSTTQIPGSDGILITTAVDLGTYPAAAFNFAMALGIFFVRRRRSRLDLPEPDFKAWDIAIIFNIFVNLYLLIMPVSSLTFLGVKITYTGDVEFLLPFFCIISKLPSLL
jgi:hypothetical protein